MAKYFEQSRRLKKLQDDLRIVEDKQFAEYLGLKQPNVSNMLRGERLGLESLMQICEMLGADPWWVWCGEGDRYRREPDDPLSLNELWVQVENLQISERLEIAVRILESLSPREFEPE